MAKSWLINGRGIAKKVKSAASSYSKQIKDSGATRECPNCHYLIDNSDIPNDWPGLPIGVKFDPSDVELLDHLAAKCGTGNENPHMFIDEFISTLERDKGICYTHPKHLPGARKDGSSIHFFHKTANAYSSGQRKRRMIQTEVPEETIRWHKTGKTKAVTENGVRKGYKKIMVLYRSLKKGSKPVKSNWVMHQYHLGNEKDEMEGEYVVSKIFFQQQKQSDKNGDGIAVKEESQGIISMGPKTPKTTTPTPNPPTPGNPLLCDDITDDIVLPTENSELASKTSHPTSNLELKEDIDCLSDLAGESRAAVSDLHMINSSPSNEIFSPCAPLDGLTQSMDNMAGQKYNGSYGISDLLNIQLDTPPDFQLPDLQFGSQDSILSWLDRL